MTTHIGLRISLECEACKNKKEILASASSFKVLRAGLQDPVKCGCGTKAPYKIVSLSQVEYTIGGVE